MRSRPLLAIGVAFLASGAAALVYQVAWQRLLALGSGASITSMALIVAAFLAGLGLGSELGGRLSRRLSPARAIRTFAALEVGVGLFGALSPWLFHDLLQPRAARLYDAPATAGVLHFLTLVVPTTLMGMSLPILTRGVVVSTRTAGRTLGLLYGWNTLGASLGALLTPWVLIRFLGIRGAVLVAAALNVAAAVLAALTPAVEPEHPAQSDVPAAVTGGAEPPARLSLWLGLYGFSGFCALALEILWFRVMEVAVRSTAFTFGTVLSLYLLGLAAGSFAGARIAPRLDRPLRAFLLVQSSLIGVAVASIGALAWLASKPTVPVVGWFMRYWAGDVPPVSLGSSEDLGGLLRLYLVLPLFLFAVPTFLMGLSFPILQRAVQGDPVESGKRVGLFQAVNIAGCVLGSLLTGLVVLDRVGTPGAATLLALGAVAFAAVGLRRYGLRSPFPGIAAALLALAFVVPDPRAFWLPLHGATGSAPGLLQEDASGVGVIVPNGDRLAVMINGLYHSWLPFGGVHTRLGAFPAVVHENPRDVAIIGLASGDTPRAAGLRSETASITVFEIFRAQPRLLQAAGSYEWPTPLPLDGLRAFLSDPRLRMVLADGRKALESEDRRYDVIEADALWPETAWSGNLFSVEFYALCASRLKPGGLMCSWTPTPRIRRTFRHVFPHVLALEGGGISIGSDSPIAIDLPAWRARLADPRVVVYLGGAETAQDVAARLEKAQLRTEPPRAEWNEDLFPRDEFLTPDSGRERH
jgi:hypothetical protein